MHTLCEFIRNQAFLLVLITRAEKQPSFTNANHDYELDYGQNRPLNDIPRTRVAFLKLLPLILFFLIFAFQLSSGKFNVIYSQNKNKFRVFDDSRKCRNCLACIVPLVREAHLTCAPYFHGESIHRRDPLVWFNLNSPVRVIFICLGGQLQNVNCCEQDQRFTISMPQYILLSWLLLFYVLQIYEFVACI